MLHEVTPRQFECLEFIRTYAEINGKNPSQYEIAKGIVSTQNSIFRMMQLLQTKGVIFRARLCSRKYTVISDYKIKEKYRD